MGFITRALGLKQAGVPSVSWDGTFSVAPLFGGWMGWGTKTAAGTTVSSDSALGIVAVYACVRVLAESVASLPLIIYHRLPNGGKERATDHPLYSVLHDAPNPDMTSFVWRETLMTHLGTWGNHYSEKSYDAMGRLQLWPAPPNRIEAKFEGGRKVFDYLSPRGGRIRMPDGKIFHVPGLSSNGLVGFSPIQVHREALGLYQALQDFGSSTMRNQARPAVILMHPKTLSKGAVERLATQMDELRGSGNAGKTVVMEEGLDLKEIGIPPEDAQYIESRKFQLEEVARMYRMQPHMIGDLEHATYTNIEHQSIDFVVHTLTPWLVRIEQEISAQLLYGEPDYFAEFNVDGLLRGDAETRAKARMIQRQGGILSREEWRSSENMNQLDKADDIWAPIANYQPVSVDDAATEATETPAEAALEPTPEPPPNIIDFATAAQKSASDALVRVAEESIGAQERISERFASTLDHFADAMKTQPISVDATTHIAEGAFPAPILPPITVEAPNVTVQAPESRRKVLERDADGRITALVEE